MNTGAIQIVMAYPYVPEAAIAGVADVLRSRFIGQGPLVDAFERNFERKFGIPAGCAVAVNSGTSALELAYDLLGLDQAAHVITTPLTCTATNIPLVRRGCHLDFADVELETLTLDPDSVRDLIRSQTRAIVNVHLHGVISDLPDFGPVPVIDDAAQALGAPRPGARFTTYSFQAIKHITTGDGGMLVCARPEEAREAKLRRWFGIDRALKLSNDWQPFLDRQILFDIQYPGYKFQMTDIAAAMGIVGLDWYDDIMLHRTEIFEIYVSSLLPIVDGAENRYGYACLVVDDREQFCKHMARAGVETNVMHVRNDVYSIFKKFRRPLAVMDWLENRYVCIPMHNKMTLDDAWRVAKAASAALEGHRYHLELER